MRNKFLNTISVIYTVSLLYACGGNSGGKESSAAFPKDFPTVSVPAMVTDMGESLAYISLHYWDRYVDSASVWCAYDDTTRLGGVSVDNVRAAYAEYVRILWNVPVPAALAAQNRMMGCMETAALRDTSFFRIFDEMCSLADGILYGVNSDFRNEEFYIPVLERLVTTPLKTPLTEKVLKDKYSEQLANCKKNRIGEVAADFSYATASGATGTLYGVKGDVILLFFSNPGCKACLEIINSLKASGIVSQHIAAGRLKVLNIYIDEDLAEWYKYMPEYPDEWLNAYQPDLKVRQEGIYDVRAIPSLYILDKEKHVLFKDVNPEVALAFLEKMPVER